MNVAVTTIVSGPDFWPIADPPFSRQLSITAMTHISHASPAKLAYTTTYFLGKLNETVP